MKALNEGMKIYQARMYKTIMGNDQDHLGMGFKMEDRRWIGVGDLEAWASECHSHGPETVWNAIRGTEDFGSKESAYMVLVFEAEKIGYMHIFVGCRHSRGAGGASSSGYGQGSYGSKRPRWNQGHW